MTNRVARPRVSSLLARRNRHGVYLTRLGVQKLTAYVRQTKDRRKYGLRGQRERPATPSLEPASPIIVPESEATTSSRESTPCLLRLITPPLPPPPTPESLPPSPVTRSPPTPPSSELPSSRELELYNRIAELEEAKQESACVLAYNLDYNLQELTALFREHDDIVHDLLEHCEARYERLRDCHLAAAHDTCKRRHEFLYRRLSQAITLLNEITTLPDYSDEDPQDIVDGKFPAIMDYGKIVRWIGKLEIEAEDALGATGAVNLRGNVQQLRRRGYGLTPAARTARRAAQT
ncbi:hypothetical protein LTR78_010905 [Recurvomyces mirabilis]|uniref:Uncharacterized protein n=1 Tax=Recurvomyces mirabilis TaxID=574656 RepID=A0AAE0TLV9_9PEZI|nr:hypothetical protein LTR78_010905 [Recurvomyces mirabilis]KAK5149904.1 hypothetical protein LTS14_010509 [Recurvomyces mirabilis]